MFQTKEMMMMWAHFCELTCHMSEKTRFYFQFRVTHQTYLYITEAV